MSSVVVICCLFLPLFGLHSPLLPKRVRKGCAEPMKRPSASSSMLKKPAKSVKKPSRTAEGAAGVSILVKIARLICGLSLVQKQPAQNIIYYKKR